MSQIITANLPVLKEAAGTVHVPPTFLPVDLNCLDNLDNLLKSLLKVVFLIHDEGEGTLTESATWVSGAIVATKITDRCSGDVVYVSTPIHDVVGAQHPCCSGSYVFPPITLDTEDGNPILTENDQNLQP